MLNLKKTAVAVLAFGSSAVFAGTMGPVCTPGSVTVPCPRTAWDFGAQALYLQPSYSNQEFIGSTVNGAGAAAFQKVKNPWAWGFQIEASYHFNTGNDLDVNWYHYDRSRNGSLPIADGTSFVDVYGENWAPGTRLSVNGSSKWDAVNVEFGQHVDFGEFVKMRFHGGVEYARIKTQATLSGTLVGSTATAVVPGVALSAPQNLFNTASYSGFGPRVGLDFGYGWNNGLAVYAKSAMSMLVGTNKYSRTSAQPTLVTSSGTTALPIISVGASSTTVNPELEAKIGAAYTYAMAQGDLSLDIGWMWVNYFNVQTNIISSNTTAAQRGIVTRGDFGVQGPYLGLKWVGNVV